MTEPTDPPARDELAQAAISAEAAARYMGGPPITADTMKTLARRKQIGHIKVGRTTVFPISALDAYIEAHTVQPIENPWGLTDLALRHIREGRPQGRGRTF